MHTLHSYGKWLVFSIYNGNHHLDFQLVSGRNATGAAVSNLGEKFSYFKRNETSGCLKR